MRVRSLPHGTWCFPQTFLGTVMGILSKIMIVVPVIETLDYTTYSRYLGHTPGSNPKP